MTALCHLLNDELRKTGWTRAEFAHRMRVTPVHMSRWLLDQVPMAWRHYRRTAEVFDIPLKRVLDAARKDHPEKVRQFYEFIA